MKRTPAHDTLPANIEWERAPGETKRLPWLFAGREPEPEQAATTRGFVARLLGRRAEHTG
jgi:hypothetical protein